MIRKKRMQKNAPLPLMTFDYTDQQSTAPQASASNPNSASPTLRRQKGINNLALR